MHWQSAAFPILSPPASKKNKKPPVGLQMQVDALISVTPLLVTTEEITLRIIMTLVSATY